MATSSDSANKIGFDVRCFRRGSGFQIPFLPGKKQGFAGTGAEG
jgi:hypothetical protein